MTTLEAQAKQKLYLKRLLIDDKGVKLYDKKEAEADERIKKQYAKAERQVKQRLINQEKKIKNKQRSKEGKPLLKVKVKKINHMARCDDLFSKYIRKKYGNICYTCGSTDHIGNGHYISRKIRKLRRDEDNCRPQAFYCCNAKFGGNGKPVEFEARLKKDGVDVDRLKKIALGDNTKPKEHELIEIYNRILDQYNSLQ